MHINKKQQKYYFLIFLKYFNLRYIVFFILLVVAAAGAGCDNCDCVNTGNGITPEHTIYFSASAINTGKLSSFFIEDNSQKITKIADNSQIFSAPSYNNKIALLNFLDTKKIILRNLSDSITITEIAFSKKQNFGNPVISNSGNRILFHQENELYLWNFDSISGGSYLELITSNYNYTSSLATFSDDDRHIVFIDNNNNNNSGYTLKIVETGQLENIIWQKKISKNTNEFIKINWITKKNILYFVLDDTTMCKYNLTSGEEFISFGSSNNLGIKTGCISADEKYIAFLSKNNEIWIKNTINNGFYKLSTEKYTYSDIQWNYNNTKLLLLANEELEYFSTSKKNLYLLDIIFNNNIPVIKNKILVFNNVRNAIWGRSK